MNRLNNNSLNKYLIIIIPTVSIIVTTLVVFLVLMPWVKDVQTKQNEVETNKQVINQLINKLNILNLQDSDKSQDYLLDLELAVPRYPLAPTLMGIIEQTVNETGLVMSSIQYSGIISQVSDANTTVNEGQNIQQVSNTNNSGSIAIQISVQGDYFKIVSLLKTLQVTRPLFDVTELRVANSQENTSTDDTTIEKQAVFKIQSPFYALSEDLGSETNQISELSKEELELINKIQIFKSYLSANTTPGINEFPMGKENPF